MVSTSLVVLSNQRGILGGRTGDRLLNFAMFGLIVLYNRLVIAQRQEKVSKTQAVNFAFCLADCCGGWVGLGSNPRLPFLMESSLGLPARLICRWLWN